MGVGGQIYTLAEKSTCFVMRSGEHTQTYPRGTRAKSRAWTWWRLTKKQAQKFNCDIPNLFSTTIMPSAHYCAYCKARIPTVDGIAKHYARKKACGKKYYEQIAHSAITVWDDELESNLPENDALSTSSSLAAAADGADQFENDTLEAINVEDEPADFQPPQTCSLSPDDLDTSEPKSKRARVEEVEDEDAPKVGRYTEDYPRQAADILGQTETKFEHLHSDQASQGIDPYSPFTDSEEWELVRWLMKNVGQNKTDDFLKLPIVCHSNCDCDSCMLFMEF